jgi:uncharacterized glyoxalase superfamily protein PhnB
MGTRVGIKQLPSSDGQVDEAEWRVWMSIWVDDVDAIHRQCLEQGLDVAWPPTDMPWGVREMHVRHPDGHVFRISKGIEQADKARQACQ